MAGYPALSALLRALLSNLSSNILNECWLLCGVEKEKRKLESNLSAIAAVLQDAERRQVNEMAVKDWLQKLKAAAYDAEDLVDEFRIEALRRKVENQAGMREKVRHLFCPLVFYFKMAHKMQKLRENFEAIAEERDCFHFKVEAVPESQPLTSGARETTSAIEPAEVYGRDTEKANLVHLLIKSESEEDLSLSVIPIVGMGGLGKTTLAQLVYNDQRVVAHFKLRMWVYVSPSFDVGKLLREILGSATEKKAEPLSMDILQNQLREELSGKRYLLVLDDVWNDSPNEWFRLKALLMTCGANGSKILVTTRHDGAAKIMETVPRLRLGILSNEDSWDLFRKLVNPPPLCEAIGKEMVEKCGGLPLAIKTLGGLMSFKTTEDEWKSVRDSQFWNHQDDGGEILPTLRLSYDHLRSSLKQCFAYCAVFPQGHVLVKHKLIKQWIALGFILSDEEDELLEEKAESYFNELLQRSLFQDYMEPDVNYVEEYYKMHDLIHDLARFVGGKECFIVKASMDTVPRETRHLTVQDDKWAREPKNWRALKKCKKLRSMFTLQFCYADINACLSLACLRVLDLSGTNIVYLPNSIEKLKHLRYLDVSDTSVRKLPETICNLHGLQTLRIVDCKVRMLPRNMKRMISLRHIELDQYMYHSLLPKGIGELTCLRTLSTFVVGGESGPGIEELKGLNRLWGTFCIRGLNHVRNGKCAHEANLKAKEYLHSLKLLWFSDDGTIANSGGNSEEVIEKLEPHSRLQKLAVVKYMGLGFPNWMKMLTNLTDVELRLCNSCEHLPPLWKLPFLESLRLEMMGAVKYIIEFDGSDNSKDIFPSLKHLALREMPNLEGWSSQQEDGDGDGDEQGRERDEPVIFQGLRTLKLFDCPKLMSIPWLHHVSSLTCLNTCRVGCEMIQIPTSQSLTEVTLSDMPNFERWSLQEADDDDNQMIFPSLRNLRIDTCPKLIFLPPLLLPALEELEMKGVSCDKIEFSTSHLLQRVYLVDMPSLERLSLQESNDNKRVEYLSFVKLCVHKCPRMAHLPHLLPSAISLAIFASNEMLLTSVANYMSLAKFSIRQFPEVRYLPEELGPNHTSLHTLKIKDCPKLVSLLNQLENLIALKKLIIEGCKDLVLSLTDGLQQQQQRSPPLNSLEVLKIKNSCEKQTSLPGEGIVLTSLRDLAINSCGNLESVSADMLENLTSLEIVGCPKLWSSLVSLENLKSIESLKISGCPDITSLLGSMENLTSLIRLQIENCPGERPLPESMKNLKSLTKLVITSFPGIRSLPESMGDLTMLTQLSIWGCPKITTLPKGLQRLKNLRFLQISECPVLEEKLQLRKGPDWHKVVHVPDIRIGSLNARG